MELPSPSREEWQRLYVEAIASKREAPREWMYEDEIAGHPGALDPIVRGPV
jgi:hypothetical protein